MEQKWTHWKPVKKLSSKYYIDSIADNLSGFEIFLSERENKNTKIHIIFQDSVDSYRYIDESYVQKTIMYLNKIYGKDFYAHWSFFKVENSDYLKQLSEESDSLSDHIDFIHFVLLLGNSMIDIVATYEPIVRKITTV